MTLRTIRKTHQTATGHRIPGHEDGRGKCARLHGHTYEFAVTLSGEVLDANGFVADFGLIKKILDEWDHRTVLWENDVLLHHFTDEAMKLVGIVKVPFVPTSEHMADYLAKRFVDEFENVVNASVVVRESPTSEAEFWWSAYDAKTETNVKVWPMPTIVKH